MLGQGHAFVVGLPTGFELNAVLAKATNIKLAAAFAQLKGWHHFRDNVESGGASVSLLAGGWFFLTQPALLWEWHDLALAHDRVEAKLATDATHFHPKVLIVESNGAQPDFAIVGSGNLSLGGLRDNTECSVYIDSPDFIKELNAWFSAQFRSAKKLTPPLIKEYGLSYKANYKRVKAIQNEERRTAKQLASVGEATIAEWNRMVTKAKEYFRDDVFNDAYDTEARSKTNSTGVEV